MNGWPSNFRENTQIWYPFLISGIPSCKGDQNETQHLANLKLNKPYLRRRRLKDLIQWLKPNVSQPKLCLYDNLLELNRKNYGFFKTIHLEVTPRMVYCNLTIQMLHWQS